MILHFASCRDADPLRAEEELDVRGADPAAPARDFLDALLAALMQMAAASPRRQADVAMAMRRSGLSAPAGTVAAALDRLRSDGCVEGLLHLSDGGILVSVTVRGVEHLATTSHHHAAAAMMAGGVG